MPNFGSNRPGYLGDQIRQAAMDCQQGRHAITRMWGEVLQAMAPVAYEIEDAEGDGGGSPADLILISMKQIEAINHRWSEILHYLLDFEAVTKAAIERHERERTTP